jgi:hypothetical protein
MRSLQTTHNASQKLPACSLHKAAITSYILSGKSLPAAHASSALEKLALKKLETAPLDAKRPGTKMLFEPGTPN